MVLLAPALSPAPTSPACTYLLHLDIFRSGRPTPVPCRMPDIAHTRSASLLQPSFATMASVVTAARTALRTLYLLPWRKQFSGLPLRVPSTAADINLFKEEISWKGEVGEKVRPLKALVIQVTAMRPSSLPSPLPHPTTGCTTDLGACRVGRHS